jgi:hypothetical protein
MGARKPILGQKRRTSTASSLTTLTTHAEKQGDNGGNGLATVKLIERCRAKTA